MFNDRVLYCKVTLYMETSKHPWYNLVYIGGDEDDLSPLEVDKVVVTTGTPVIDKDNHCLSEVEFVNHIAICTRS